MSNKSSKSLSISIVFRKVTFSQNNSPLSAYGDGGSRPEKVIWAMGPGPARAHGPGPGPWSRPGPILGAIVASDDKSSIR